MLKILSLGAGVQSSAVLDMSIHGLLPKLDAAVFADTQWEPPAVYTHLWWLAEHAAEAGIPVYIVSKGNIRVDALRSVHGRGRRYITLPWYTASAESPRGMGRRQCTSEYKIEPINAFIRRHFLGLRPRQRAPLAPQIEQWFGISADEAQRMKPPGTKKQKELWKVHAYPLCNTILAPKGIRVEQQEFLPHNWRRQACLDYLAKMHPDRRIPRSACKGCPYHSDREWRRMKTEDPESFEDAVDFDRAIRVRKGMRDETFLHAQRIPLEFVDFRTDEELGQRSLFGNECEGMCGV